MIDFDALTQAILRGATQGLTRGARVVEARARQRAPVRNIFGTSYRFRQKDVSELAADIRFLQTKTIEDILESGDMGHFGTRWVGPKNLTKQGLVKWRERTLEAAEEHLALYEAEDETPLTRRGAFEVRSKRAAFTSKGVTHIGGRLRGEIHAIPAKLTGGMAEAWVISPTPYARYQEFGTRHNRAHPYLRPALEESHGEVVALVASAVAEASKKGVGNVNLEIKVRL